MQDIWQAFLTIIREEFGSRIVETWFKALQFKQWDAYNKKIILETPNKFVTDWLKENYMPLLEQHLGRLLNEPSITIIFHQTDLAMPTNNTTIVPAMTLPADKPVHFTAARPLVTRETAVKTLTGKTIPSLNSNYTFDSFIVGPSNYLAFAAAQAVAETPGRLYNPLFMYGGSGLGKTHLLHAIGNYVKNANKKMHILYQSADRFVHEFIQAIRFDKVYQFEMKYKDVDVLLIDDIQFISNKEQTQEAFFHIFNLLHQCKKQIVCSSDSMPCDIAGLADRMRSRLEGGLITDIQLPTLETKIAILKQKADHQEILLEDEIATFIATKVYSNIRELEGALIRVLAHAKLAQQPLSLDLAHRALMRSAEHKPSSLDLPRIAQIVAQHFEYSITEIRSAKRNKELAYARHVALYMMKKLTNRSLREIGTFLERKDHTTVMHALEKIEHQKKYDKQLSMLLQQLEHKITSTL